MLDFRKVLLALSVAGLGLVGTASAQVPAYSVGGTEGYVAAEGTTEQLPPLTITQTNAATPTGTPTFLLTSNVPFANQLVAGSTSVVDVIVSDGATDKATVTQPGPTTIQIAFNSGLSAGQTITVSNLRVNASQAPVSSQITISVAATGVTINAAAASVNLGFVTKALTSVTVNASGAVANTSSCGLLKTTVFPVANIGISEGFPDALKAVADSTAGNAMVQGTGVAITLTNLDPGVDYYVPPTITTGTLVLTAYTAGSGGVVATPVASGTGAGSILVTSAAPTIYYVVTATGGVNNTIGPIVIPVTASVPSVSGVTSFSTSPIAASVVLVGVPAPGYPGYSGAITYASSAPPSGNNGQNGLITACATTLLFPYVTNATAYGYDTGIEITNASTLPTGVAGITAASGSCTVSFYGTGAATAAPVSVNYGTVTTGTIGTPFAMSQSAAAGLTGYAVAVCNFVGAHGYAYISDDLTANNGVAANYLAVILASGGDGYAPAGPGTLAGFPVSPVITPTN